MKKPRRKREYQSNSVGILLEPLEPRLLLSGSWGAGVEASPAESQANTHGNRGQETVALHADANISDPQAWQQQRLQTIGRIDLLANAPVLKAFPAGEAIESADHGAATADRTQELIFVDAGIQNYAQLVDDIMANTDDNRSFEVIILEADRDGVEQISRVLADRQDLDAVHFVTHGEAGAAKLGDTWLNGGNLEYYAGDIAGWQDSLRPGADLLFYGCDLAAGEDGRILLDNLSRLTNADVAASDDLTGTELLGGDWDLEYTRGTVETGLDQGTLMQARWMGLLGQITVTTTADTLDGDANTNNLADLVANPGADGEISLREAIKAANNEPDADTIFLQAGTYTITRSGFDDDSGDYDIREDLSIVGVSPSATVIDGANSSTVFDVHDDAAISVSISNLKIEDGLALVLGEEKGAGLNIKGALNTPDVYIDNLWFSGNISNWSGSGTGGAIANAGNLTITNSLIEGNRRDKGGGIWNSAFGALTMENVTVSGNNATGGDGGGIWSEGIGTLRNVTVTANDADDPSASDGNGGGIFLKAGSTLDVGNSIIAGNTAEGGKNDVRGDFTSSGSNIIQDPTSSTGFAAPETGIDPLLGGLTNNGGDLMTHAPGGPGDRRC